MVYGEYADTIILRLVKKPFKLNSGIKPIVCHGVSMWDGENIYELFHMNYVDILELYGIWEYWVKENHVTPEGLAVFEMENFMMQKRFEFCIIRN